MPRMTSTASPVHVVLALVTGLVAVGVVTLAVLGTSSSGSEEKHAKRITSELATPERLGAYERLTGPENDSLRAQTLAGMHSGSDVTDRLVEYYGDERNVVFILQAAVGTFSPGPNLFANEQRALEGGGLGMLTGAVDRTVDTVTMQCDGAILASGSIAMCMHAIDGLIVVGSGINLDTNEVASLVAEAVTAVVP